MDPPTKVPRVGERPAAIGDAPPNSAARAGSQRTPRAGRPKHILLVEDEPGLRHLLRITLTDPDFRISETGSGAQALALVHSSPPDLIILDLYLTPPHPDGLEVCQRL